MYLKITIRIDECCTDICECMRCICIVTYIYIYISYIFIEIDYSMFFPMVQTDLQVSIRSFDLHLGVNFDRGLGSDTQAT